MRGAEKNFALELAEGNARWRSWREKLDFARSLLVREESAITSDQLVDISIYLRFLGTGEIACVEDGRHFRPAHQARIASQIQERLASLANQADLVTNLRPGSVKEIEDRSDLWVDSSLGNMVLFVVLNTTQPPFDNSLVREAFDCAVDRQAIAPASLIKIALVETLRTAMVASVSPSRTPNRMRSAIQAPW